MRREPLSLDDFVEQRRPIFHRPGEDLQQIALFVAIDQDAQIADRLGVFA